MNRNEDATVNEEWIGVRVSTQDEFAPQAIELLRSASEHTKTYLLIEPMHGRFFLEPYLYAISANTAGPWHYPSGRIVPSRGAGGCMMCAIPANELNLVVVEGGEKPLHPEWVREVRDACIDAGVPFFFKGWGEWMPEVVPGVRVKLSGLAPNQCVAANDAKTHIRFTRVGKAASGRLLDGVEWTQLPASLKDVP